MEPKSKKNRYHVDSVIFFLAEEVQFAATDSDKNPAVVILAFPDQEHLLSLETINALHKLTKMKESRPLLEIKIIDQEHLNLRLRDIYFEIGNHINNLKYCPAEIKSFIEKTDHFIFVLGLFTPDKKHITLIFTEKSGSEFLMMYGYKYIT